MFCNIFQIQRPLLICTGPDGATTLVQQFIVYLARTPHACRDASARHLKSVCYQEPDYSKLLGAGDLWSLVKTIVTRSVTIF